MLIALVRTVVLYLLIVVGIRLMGKRQVGELEPAELVLAMLLSDLASVPMQDFGIPLSYGAVPIVTLLCMTMILSILTVRSLRLRLLLCGRPSILVEKGHLLQKEMAKVRVSPDELMEELRLLGVTDLSCVKYAILETSGRLSAILYTNQNPVTPAQMDLSTDERGLPLTVVDNGTVYPDNLRRRGLDRRWLDGELKKRGLTSVHQVFLMTVDEQGGVYLCEKEGNP